MYNPAYLTLSRHNVYYFRWPLPEHLREQGKTAYIKLSLRTRNPKEALMHAKAMAYHAEDMTNHPTTQPMTYIEIKSLLESFVSGLLAQKKLELDTNGPFLPAQLHRHRKGIKYLEEEIAQETKHVKPEDRDEHYDEPNYSNARHVLNTLEIPIPSDPSELDRIEKMLRRSMIAYHNAVIDHNAQLSQFNFHAPKALPRTNEQGDLRIEHNGYRLRTLIDKYIAEMSVAETWGIRAKEERISCYEYLMELFGDGFAFASIDTAKARYVKECLLHTPTNRNKLKATRDLPLLQQIEVEGMETLSVGSINKYLQCYKTLYGWAVRNNYITKNPFEGLDIKEGGKNKKKRDWFKPAQTSLMLAELDKGKDGLADTDMKYWGTLIGLYTGARLNEIASLTPNDIKQDATTGIWYFDINDEEEKKRLKTAAATRLVPVHSDLIQRGLLKHVEQVKQTYTADTRILPNLTYSEKEGWGRKLTRWFSNVYLPRLDLKTDRTSFHSLRHTTITTMRRHDVDNHTIRNLVGHEPEGITEEIYIHGYNLEQLQEAIEKIRYL